MARFPVIKVNDKAAARIGRGHLWVFSNEIAGEDGTQESGGEVAILSPKDEFLGSALYNKNALIRARVYTRQSEALDETLLHRRLSSALERRQRLVTGRNAWRMVFSEADLLPGLIVDRYADVLSVQFLTLGMDRRRDTIVKLLVELCQPRAIVERSDTPARGQEGLEQRKGLLHGELDENEPVTVAIGAVTLGVNVLAGQKTGLFLDQADNWRLMEWLAPGRRMIDLFCHEGGFALNAAKAGAASVRAVDASGEALSRLLFNAGHNGIDNIKAKEADVFPYVRARPDIFDLIVCDPPAFAKSRKQVESALRGYRELNRHCIKMLTPGGILVTCSCSAAVDEASFDKMLTLAARDAGRTVRLLPGGGQPADHAPLLAMPETRYLKVRILEAVD